MQDQLFKFMNWRLAILWYGGLGYGGWDIMIKKVNDKKKVVWRFRIQLLRFDLLYQLFRKRKFTFFGKE